MNFWQTNSVWICHRVDIYLWCNKTLTCEFHFNITFRNRSDILHENCMYLNQQSIMFSINGYIFNPITQNKGKERENSYQKFKRSRWTGTRKHTVTKSKYLNHINCFTAKWPSSGFWTQSKKKIKTYKGCFLMNNFTFGNVYYLSWRCLWYCLV